jgi:hypothetical protein
MTPKAFEDEIQKLKLIIEGPATPVRETQAIEYVLPPASHEGERIEMGIGIPHHRLKFVAVQDGDGLMWKMLV